MMEEERDRPRLPELDMVLPVVIGDMAFRGSTRYDDSPGAGLSLRYENERGWYADLYEYDMGRAGLPDGIESRVVLEEYFSSLDDIAAGVEEGDYEDCVLERQAVWTNPEELGPVELLFAQLSLAYPDEGGEPGPEAVSYLVFTAWEGQFLKLQFTVPGEDEEEGEAAAWGFVKELVDRLPWGLFS